MTLPADSSLITQPDRRSWCRTACSELHVGQACGIRQFCRKQLGGEDVNNATRDEVLARRDVDDPEAVPDLSAAAPRAGTMLEVLVEIDCGAGRCGIAPGEPARDLALAVANASGLRFAGIQAYHGRAQHLASEVDRRMTITAYAGELLATGAPVELAGDYNVMPIDLDVYKPQRWLDDALFRPQVRYAFQGLIEQG